MSTNQGNISSRQIPPPRRRNGTNASYTSSGVPNYREPPQLETSDPFQYALDSHPSTDEIYRAARANMRPQTPACSPPSPQLSIISTDGRRPMHEAPNYMKGTYHKNFQEARRRPSGLAWPVCQEAVPSNSTTIMNVEDIPDPLEKNEKHDKDSGCGSTIQ